MVLSKHNLVWAVFNMGKVHYHNRMFVDAVKAFSSLIGENDMYIQAYDWLARTLEAMGDTKSAQKTLEAAVSKSPRAIFRQRALGNVAFGNKDYDTAEGAFKRAVHIGKTSLFKDPADYIRLAKVYIKKEDHGKALDLIDEARADFIDNDEVLLQATLTETYLCRHKPI
ncbi:MAG: tetratricopeptide repeat protein [Nitrospirae bacterium]|nr:tetratricopeptide repeat protein [Nitrospirota bacterium]